MSRLSLGSWRPSGTIWRCPSLLLPENTTKKLALTFDISSINIDTFPETSFWHLSIACSLKHGTDRKPGTRRQIKQYEIPGTRRGDGHYEHVE